MVYYKYLNADRKSPLQDWQWPRVGTWTKPIDGVAACERGYHACRTAPHFDLLEWSGEHLYEIELRGDIIVADTKVVAPQARLVRQVKTWNARTQRLFTCDCAARVLKIYERDYPNDKRPREAIRVAQAFANGKASTEELVAARAAAWDAARDAARVASRVAAWVAARAAARDAARVAAWDDAWDDAWVAEKKWQLQRMTKYIEGEIA